MVLLSNAPERSGFKDCVDEIVGDETGMCKKVKSNTIRPAGDPQRVRPVSF